MKPDERIGGAVLAAAIGATVAATMATAEDHREDPVLLMPPAPSPPEVSAAPAASGRAPATSGSAQFANAISLLAAGAFFTVLVLWVIGTFDPSSSVQATSSVGGSFPSGPATAAELLAEPDVEEAPEVDQEEDAEPSPPEPDRPAEPAFVDIPAIGVRADVIDLGLDPTGALEVPEDFAQTGWWTGGPRPGEPGPAVIVGHVDSFQGPAVFFNLDQLAYDDLIRVTRSDGTSVTYAVRSTVAVDKDNFPTELVYGESDGHLLRLITCDGDFSNGSYLGNLIVTAELLREHPVPATGPIS